MSETPYQTNTIVGEKGPRIKWGWSSRRIKRTFLEKIEGVWMRSKKMEIDEVDEPLPNPPILPPSPPPMSTTEPPQYPPDCLPYRTLSLATMWEMGIMEKWVEDFARCEELVEEIVEKVSLVIDYKNQEVKK